MPNARKVPLTSCSLPFPSKISVTALLFPLLPSIRLSWKGKQRKRDSLCHSDFTEQHVIFSKTRLNFLFFFYFNFEKRHFPYGATQTVWAVPGTFCSGLHRNLPPNFTGVRLPSEARRALHLPSYPFQTFQPWEWYFLESH